MKMLILLLKHSPKYSHRTKTKPSKHTFTCVHSPTFNIRAHQMKRKVRLLIKKKKKMFETTNWNASSAIVRKFILLFYLRYVRSCFSFYFGQIVQWAGVVQPGRSWFLFFFHLSLKSTYCCMPSNDHCNIEVLVCLCIDSPIVFSLWYRFSLAQLTANTTEWAHTILPAINFTFELLLKSPMKMLISIVYWKITTFGIN